MPPPIKVELVAHSSTWELAAREETLRLVQAFEGAILDVHHIGSTAIPGIRAKPVVDLLPVVRSITDLEAMRSVFMRLGYEYWGEYGIPGRRYCSLDDPASGRRKFQLHCFESDSDQIERHLAFREYLRANPMIAREYDQEKHRCRELHPDDSHAYSDAKAAWIAGQLPVALAYSRASR